MSDSSKMHRFVWNLPCNSFPSVCRRWWWIWRLVLIFCVRSVRSYSGRFCREILFGEVQTGSDAGRLGLLHVGGDLRLAGSLADIRCRQRLPENVQPWLRVSRVPRSAPHPLCRLRLQSCLQYQLASHLGTPVHGGRTITSLSRSLSPLPPHISCMLHWTRTRIARIRGPPFMNCLMKKTESFGYTDRSILFEYAADKLFSSDC